MRTSRSIAAALALVFTALAAPVAAQDVATASALFTRGLADMQAGNYDRGCPALEGSYKLEPLPGTLFTLAECENKRGRLATALARYDDYLLMVARMPPAQQKKHGDRVKIAETQKAALGPEVPMLTLSLSPRAPKGTVVKRDGTELMDAALGVALPVDPGEHEVTTQAPGGEVTEVRVTLGKGEKKQVTLKVKVASPPPQVVPSAPPERLPETETTHGPGGQRVGAYVAGGVGVAGLILGGVMGGLALGKKSDIQKNCNFPDDPRGCNDTGLADVSSARTMGTVSTIGFSIGGVGVVTAVVLLLTEPKRVTASRGVRVGVLSRGRAGGALAVEGVW